MRRVPAPSVIAGWAVRYGPLVAPFIQKLYEQGRHRQLAILHARTVVDGTFSWEMVNGERVWVVWAGDEVLATYPELAGGTDGLFTGARVDRRQDPDDVLVRRVRRRLSEVSLPSLPGRGDRSDEAVDDDGDVPDDEG